MVAYSFKARFVDPIRSGLGYYEHIDGMNPTPKRQTIRAYGKRRHAREGETLQLYTAMRTKQCKKIADVRCTEVSRIIIWPAIMVIMVNGLIMTARQIQKFARADGFADAADMQAFWHREHGDAKFEGVLIRWEPLT